MTSIRRKIIRDFWHERARTVLVVFAIALGIAAFAAVLSSYAILTRELDRGYLATNPASATLRLDKIDDDLLRLVRSQSSISNAEPRRVVSAQIRSGPAQWRNAILFVVKDYGHIEVSKLEPEKGAWPPATGEILIERDAFQVARTAIGQSVTVKTAKGEEQQLYVSGSVHDVGQAQARMENIVYGYITLDTLQELGEEPYLDQLNILVAENRFDEGHIRRVANEIKQLIESSGHTVRRVDVPRPGKHPHSDLMGLLLLAMSSFGIFVLFLSGILVINFVTALMAAQVRQIGVMKAVGGTRRQIASLYFGEAALLGIVAVILGIPLGLLGGRALCRYMATFLNFDINSFFVPLWVYIPIAIVGIATPLIAAAYPVWKGSSLSVHQALASFGVQNNFGSSLLDRAVSSVSGRFRVVALVLRNCLRRRARTALTLITLAAGGLFFMSALNIRASMIRTLDRWFATKKSDLTIGLGNMYPMERVDRAIRETPGITRGEGWFTSEASIIDQSNTNQDAKAEAASGGSHSVGSNPDRFSVIAVPPNTGMLDLDIVAGRKLLPDDFDAIVVNNTLASKDDRVKVGKRINLRMGPADTSWLIVGIAREAFSPPVAYISRNFTDQRYPAMVNSIRLSLDKTDDDSIGNVKSIFDQNLRREGIRAVGSVSKADSRFGFDQHMLMIYIFLIVMSGIIAGVGGLGMMTTTTLNVLERRREMGVLRAIGATPAVVWLMVAGEALLIGLLSWLLAAVLAWPISKIFGDLLAKTLFTGGLDFVFSPLGLLVWLVVSIVVSVVSSFVPSWRAARLTVREAIAYE